MINFLPVWRVIHLFFLHNHGQAFLIRKRTILNKLNPNTASQIFDTMVFPILSYNSEVWGMYTKQDFKKWDSSPIEKIHLKFCKRYLEVNNKASNIACRAELDRLPLLIPINQKIMKYFVYLNNKDNDSIINSLSLCQRIYILWTIQDIFPIS